MGKQYASSVHSQKSATSARSFLSTASLNWPSKGEISKSKVWQSLKSWIPSNSASTSTVTPQSPKEASIAAASVTNSATTITSLTKSYNINKLRLLFKKKNTNNNPEGSILDEEDQYSNCSSSDNTYKSSPLLYRPTGILTSCTDDSEEAIAAMEKRKNARREYILKSRRQNRNFQPDNNTSYSPQQHDESSSSDTLLSDATIAIEHSAVIPTTSTSTKRMVGFANDDDNNDDDYWNNHNPRIMFVEPSPVPRFRNVAPHPPESPPYLNVVVHPDTDIHTIIRTPNTDEEDDCPTIFASKDSISSFSLNNDKTPEEDEEQDEETTTNKGEEQDGMYKRLSILIERLKRETSVPKPRIYFNAPFRRGQALSFSLENTTSDDHIIIYKFLTSNSHHGKGERYFVRPSAGKIDTDDRHEIQVYLNQIPEFYTLEDQLMEPVSIKDKLIIKWAVIPRSSAIEDWADTLKEPTRRKWVDMLSEEWADQVTIRTTRIKIRYNHHTTESPSSP